MHYRRFIAALPALLLIALSSAALTRPAAAQASTSVGAPSEGLTLFHPITQTTTYLIDTAGAVVHTWASTERHNAVYLLDDATLVRTIQSNGANLAGVQLVSWDGDLEWDFRYDNADHQHHHDVERLPNGNFLMIAWQFKTIAEAEQAGRNPAYLSGQVFSPDSIIEVQPSGPTSGTIVWEWHVWDHLIQDYDSQRDNFGVVADHPELLDVNYPPMSPGGGDWNHANAVAYNADFDQIILNSHHQNEFWIIDHSTTTVEAAGHTGGNSGRGGDFLYRWGNPEAYGAGTPADKQLFGQHNTQWIEEGLPGAGNILIFNNGNARPAGDFSTLDEVVPPVDAFGVYAHTPGTAYGPTNPVWSYQATVPTSFFSQFISGVQRLPNGNTLACSGAQSWFFEVTPAMDIVWEYDNPFPPMGNSAVFRARRYQMCADPTTYCSANNNSTGFPAEISSAGSASIDANDLQLLTNSVPLNKFGYYLMADTQAFISGFGGSQGILCIGSPLIRFAGNVLNSGATGEMNFAPDLGNLPQATVLTVGETWFFQLWFRDNNPGPTSNTSNGLAVQFCP